jgi:TonB-linked SusC/RagA family outer membrane protein
MEVELICYRGSRYRSIFLHHVLLKMKLLTFVLFVALTQVSGVGFSQKILLDKRNIPLGSAFKEIEKQTDYLFLYDKVEVPVDRRVSVNVQNATIDETLKQLFKGLPLSYKVFNSSIVVRRDQTGAQKRFDIDPSPEAAVTVQKVVRTVVGRVTDEKDDGLPGVNIVLEGTSQGTITDIDGRFSLEVPDDKAVLVFSFVGYISQQVIVGNNSNIAVKLMEDTKALEELVVVGYGVQKKSDLTGSVTRLSGKNFENQQKTQLTDMLAGTIAGFNSNQGTTSSGGGSMEIRGRTSLNANTSPLVVLDGVIFNGSVQDIAPSDVETIDVLKDASSAAVFGSRASSGVILITTKKGAKGKPKVTFSAETGISEVTNSNIRPLSGEEYTDFRREWQRKLRPNQPQYYFHDPRELPSQVSVEEWKNFNTNPNEDLVTEWLNRLLFFPTETSNYLAGNEVNWYDKVIRKGVKQNYDLSVGGGTENISYYWSIGYTNNKGPIVGDDFGILRTRVNANTKINRFIDLGLNAQFTSRDNSAIPASVSRMLSASPYGSVYDEDGSLKWFPNDFITDINPLMEHRLHHNKNVTNALFATIYSNVKLPFGIDYKLSFQPRFSSSHHYAFYPSTTPTGFNVKGRGSRSDSRVYEWMVDNLLTWRKEIAQHSFDVTFLYNMEKFQSWSSSLTAEGFSPNENLSYHALQFATRQILSNDDNYSTGDALMGRLNYGFKDKYLLTLSVRRDGYSAFGQGNPRATFPAGAIAWKISEEKFFNIPAIDVAKLRLSWGANGNREIGRYAALARLSQNFYSDGSQVLVGVLNNSLANPGLAWEKTTSLNLGMDFRLRGGKIDGSIDVYNMSTTNLLMNRVLPQITGFRNIAANLGELRNRGLELTINSVNRNTNQFSWKSNFVFSLNRNKIMHLFGDFQEVEQDGKIVRREVSDITNGWFIGQAVDRVWDYDIVGVWQLNEAEEAKRYALTPGDYKAVDSNNDGRYSLDDKQFIGWQEPRFRLGLRNEFTFNKNLFASIFLRGEFGHIDAISDFIHPNNGIYDRRGMRSIPYWTPENPSDKYASITAASSAFAGGYGRYFSKSFVRIQDLSVGYNLTETQLAERFKGFERVKIYLSARNLYSFDKWESWDPESGSIPMPRTYSAGINLSF